MEAKELRIGNLINIIGLVPTEVTPEHIKFISDGDDQYEPIPLTEEWLDKLGFKEGIINNEHFNFTIVYYDAWNISYTEKNGYGQGEVFLRGFYNVHQLQNLYFALTGEELIK